MTKLKTAVIGVGSLGKHHARNHAALDAEGRTEFAGVCDSNEETARATRIAREKIKAERAKRRLARERARARAIAARRPDPYAYDQPTPPDYAYAPRQVYGPFNQTQTGWGNGWNRRW